MKLPKLFVPLSILILFLFGSSGLLSAKEIQNHQALFNEMIEGGQWTPSEDPTIVRAKRVYINYDILVSNPQQLPTAVSDTAGSLVLNLFDDVVLTAVLDTLDSTIPEFFSWIGHIEGIKQSNVTLVIGEGMVQGSVTLPDAFYQISHVGNGVHAIYEIDQAAFPTELDPIPVDSPDNAIAFDMISADDGSVIDVIVFYTEKARIAAGGSDNITAQILKAGQDTNIGYANSGVIQTIHLIDPYAYDAEVRYDETNFDWTETLTRLRGNGDGYMDEVHELRNRYNADIVVLIVDHQDSCGASYSMKTLSAGFAPYAFSLVSRNCSVNNYSLAHELGHVMGSQHDHGNANIDGVYPYSYGYQDPAGVFRTLMAYDCPGGCVRVNYWSNPDVQYNGQPMGVAEGDSMAADNRKSLNNTRSIVANFRSSTGSLAVTLGPPEAVSAGAQWRVDGGAWRNSGYTESGLAVGSHAVAFRDDVAGWTAPENQSVTIASGQTTTTSGTYVQQTGSLTVTLGPAAAVAAGAQWRIKGDSMWRDGGDIQSGIVVGSYTVEFRGVSGWTAPGAKPVQITNAGMTTTSGTYVQQTGSLTVTLGPDAAISAGAQWRIRGDSTWRDGGDIQSGIVVGSYTVEFRGVSGWTAPGAKPVQITNAGMTTTSGTYVQQTGSLTVTLGPDAAISAGAQWRIRGDSTWRDSGYIQSGIVVGSYTVEFKGVSGWTAPGAKPVQITNAATTTESGTYIVLPANGSTGSLKVTLLPPEAVSAGAKWRVDGGDWFNSDYTQPGLTTGSHTVEFSAVPGYMPPSSQSVTIEDGQTATASGTYVQQTGSVTVTLGPSEAVAAGAQWRISGDSTWRNSGDTQSGIAVGSQTIEFKAVSGWTAPENQSLTISNGENASASGNYTPLATGEDSDQDGISDDEEAEGPNGGDGNGDGIADSQQAYVATLRTADADMITLETSAGVNIRNCRAVDTFSTGSLPTEVEFPHGLFEFSLVGVDPGGTVSVTLHLPDGETADVYYKFGPTADDGSDHWYDFTHDGQTGAEIDGNRITFHFIDGQRGDDDLVANGTIVDIGGPGISTVTTGGGSSDIQNDSGSGGGGGGCFIGTIRR